MKKSPWLWMRRVDLLLAGMMILAGVGCSRSPERVVEERLAGRCVVVLPLVHHDASEWGSWFRRYMPTSPQFSTEAIDDAISLCRREDRVLVVATADLEIESVRTSLRAYIMSGGRLLSCGSEFGAGGSPGHDVPFFVEQATFRFTVTSGVVRVADDASVHAISARPMACVFPLSRGTGGQQAGDGRWVPVVAALRGAGEPVGWVSSVYLSSPAPSTYSVQGWLGMDALPVDAPALLPVVEATLHQMTRQVYLYHFGLEQFSAKAQSPLMVAADWIDRRPQDLSSIRLVAEWINERGLEVRRHVSPPFDPTMSSPMLLNLGLAPDPSGRSEIFSLRILLRDRNDLTTLDMAEQNVKIFPLRSGPLETEPIVVSAGQFMQGRRPVFMLGVNYWPRLSGHLFRSGLHWLDAGWFDPEQVVSDLDLMTSVGINSIALEYTDIQQAPQLLYVLDELRKRGMWACLYMPALHPADLRMEEAGRMLDAISDRQWPEVFALEVARGLTVRSRSEWRRLDPAWADWIDEHFSSAMEAQQKLGLTLWLDRGRIAGPPDALLKQGPHLNPAIALYHAFLNDYMSRHMGYVRRWLRARGSTALVTSRSAFGWPDDQPPPGVLDVLDIATGALHQDFLFPDGWSFHPLRTMHADGGILAAHARGVGGGIPIVWSAFGHHIGTASAESSALLRQKEVYKHFVDFFVQQGSSGAFAWWFPPDRTVMRGEDWGLVNPDGSWRPVQEVFRAARLGLREKRAPLRASDRQNGPLVMSTLQWRSQQADRSGLFARAVSANVTEWLLPGTGIESDVLLDPRQPVRLTEVEGLRLLNAEWGSLTVAGATEDRQPGEKVKVYAGRTLQMEIINTGSIRWKQAVDRRAGSIWLKLSQSGHPDDWIALAPLPRGQRQTITWTPRENGVWEIQPHLIGYGKFGERLMVDVTTPPRLF